MENHQTNDGARALTYVDQITIQRTEFEDKKEKIRRFASDLPKPLTYVGVDSVDEGWFINSDHKVTGDEFNYYMAGLVDVINKDVIQVQKRTVQEFDTIYKTLDVLDKNYIDALLLQCEELRVHTNELVDVNKNIINNQENIEKAQEDIYQNQERIKKIVEKMVEFKARLEDVEHLAQADEMWNDVQRLKAQMGVKSSENAGAEPNDQAAAILLKSMENRANIAICIAVVSLFVAVVSRFV